jgi:hypothetical protein
MKTMILIILGIFFLLPLTIISYLTLLPDRINEEQAYTGNPNECWYDEGDGIMRPCDIETGEFAFFVIFLIVASPVFTTGAILLLITHYREKKKSSEQKP